MSGVCKYSLCGALLALLYGSWQGKGAGGDCQGISMSKGGFIIVTGGNDALDQAVIELAAIGCAGEIYVTAWKENTCIVTE
eukprot:917865-Ditylum_brightwellii.AAC.1